MEQFLNEFLLKVCFSMQNVITINFDPFSMMVTMMSYNLLVHWAVLLKFCNYMYY